VRPAVWFQSSPEEAAPSGEPVLEPGRPDDTTPDADAPAGPWGGSIREADKPKYAYLTPDAHEATFNADAYYEIAYKVDAYDEGSYEEGANDADADDDAYDGETDDWDSGTGGPARLPWEPVVGPTEALHGRAGGPGFTVPQGARYGLYDPENRSAWQRSHGLWQDSGIDWDDPDGTRPDFPYPADLPSDAVQSLPAIQPPVPAREAMPLAAPTAADMLPRREARPVGPGRPWEGRPVDARQPWELPPRQARGPQRPPQQPQAWQPPQQQPQAWQPPPQQRPQPGPQPQAWPPSPARQQPREAPRPAAAARPWKDASRPWEEERDTRARPASRRRGGGQQVVRVGLPVVVILAVGAGALAIMTGKAHEALQSTGLDSTATSGAAGLGANAAIGKPTATSRHGGTGQAALVFPGYPGRQGTEEVTAIAAQGTVQFAVGTADGRAAIWRRDGSGPWTLLTADTTLAQQPAGTILTSVTHGPAGWLAVGNVVAGGIPSTESITAVGQQPVVLTSKDGNTWTSATGNPAFAGPGYTVNSVAASGRGYVVVGEQVLNGVPKDALWWTPDLMTWTRGGDMIASTVSTVSSGMSDSKIFAVAASPNGFVGVGTHNGCHTAWVSSDGQHWQSYDIPKPGGTEDPLLNHVAVLGDVVVASGDLGVSGGRIPIIVVSKDGGVHWQGTPIGSPPTFKGPLGTVTAVTSDDNEFLAAGLIGPAGAQQAVTWTSQDGVTWSAAKPAGSGTQQITALAAGGGAISSIATVTAKYGTQSVEVSPAS
jgi:hypothetical protein